VYIYLKEADFNASITLDDWNFTISFSESEELDRKWLTGYAMVQETLRANPIVSIVWTKYDSYYLTRNVGAYLHQYKNGKHLIVLDDDMTFPQDYLWNFVEDFRRRGRTEMHRWFGVGIILPYDKWSTVIPAVEFVLRSITFLVHQLRPCKGLLLFDEWLIGGTLWHRGKFYPKLPAKDWVRGITMLPYSLNPSLIPKTALQPPCQFAGARGVRSKVTPYLVSQIRHLYDSNKTDLMPGVIDTIKREMFPKWANATARS
jgi:hypothetical protein